jgi:hypothetical protein
MNPIQREEVLGVPKYEAIRDQFRNRVIAEKVHRRVQVSDILSVTFENRDTVLLQIEEMLRTERITNEAGIQHEIDTYNELIPARGSLSITLFVEIPEKALRDEMLVKLAGLERYVALEVDGKAFAAQGSRDGGRADRTTAVHYLKFQLDDDAASRMASGKSEVALVVSHPAHQVRAPLSPPVRRSLAADLAS